MHAVIAPQAQYLRLDYVRAGEGMGALGPIRSFGNDPIRSYRAWRGRPGRTLAQAGRGGKFGPGKHAYFDIPLDITAKFQNCRLESPPLIGANVRKFVGEEREEMLHQPLLTFPPVPHSGVC